MFSTSLFLPNIFGQVLHDNSVSLLSSTLAKPANETKWTAHRELSQSENRPVSTTYLGGGAEVGKDLTLCVPHVARFPSTLILMWTFQPLFEIAMDMSIRSTHTSTPISLLLYVISVPFHTRRDRSETSAHHTLLVWWFLSLMVLPLL